MYHLRQALGLNDALLTLYKSIGTMFAFVNPLIYCGLNQQWINAAKFLFGFRLNVENQTANSTKNNGRNATSMAMKIYDETSIVTSNDMVRTKIDDDDDDDVEAKNEAYQRHVYTINDN